MKEILRYGERFDWSSQLDPVQDVIDFMYSLSGVEYMTEIAAARTRLAGDELKSVSQEAAAYVKVALDYITQAKCGPVHLAGLPLYYAVLNLAKVYIVLGPHRADLPTNRRHGISFPVDTAGAGTLLDEKVEVWTRGVFPLFYKTVTGETLAEHKIAMGDVYPYIVGVSAEYEHLSGLKRRVVVGRILINTDDTGRKSPVLSLHPREASKVTAPAQLKAIRDATGSGETYQGNKTQAGATDMVKAFRDQLRPCLFYHTDPPTTSELFHSVGEWCLLPVSDHPMQLPEEIPLLMAFFHLSSVARYHPLFLEKVLASRWSPLVLGVQRQGLFKFLQLTWSYIHQKNLFIHHG